ncbi:MotA/TolQ/ExbB proton channel family protein [Romeria aff. gracilis LEGE 07310]|uniref:MotA/TolQ/ExbB proton channel family protein n=1 Tax=Vasconcelosia minhoensis LEGE 07310 TaxID=915328 RepID=A0A8J7ACF9_9CYAN|nr:MotA/TolQ/ExbB proton channel family protein [Romeria gracilis]MBE9080515.1 MotA/TolQ/ExbB proton channel family protein [Romeria aff. gracilis LEGE 07310]
MENIFVAGGIVMWPLLAFSIIAIALIIERLIFWVRLNRRQRRVMQDIIRTYRHSPTDVYPKLKQNISLPVARIFLEALEIEGASPKQFHLALASAMQAELPHLRRFSTVFATIISVAPLLGLLGTILGLITSFEAIQLGDLGANAGAVTGGISEALVSTAAGLVVAIFTLLFANLFRGLYKRQVALIQEYGGQLEILYETQYERQHRTPTKAYAT